MSNITKPILLNETYEQMMGQHNALLGALVSNMLATSPMDWAGVQRLCQSGYPEAIFGIGDLLVEDWVDKSDGDKVYEYPWRVNHFGTAELAGGDVLKGMYLQAKWLTPYGVQFSHPRAFLRCPDGLAAGTYYFAIESSWGSNVAAGDVVAFTLASPVPEGGRLAGCYYAPDRNKSDWRIYSYGADGKTIIETVVPVFETPEGAVNLGVQKYATRNGDINSCQEMAYGWNRYKYCAFRQWLNSALPAGQWWLPQDEWDIAPDQLAAKPGFLSGLPEDMLAVLRPVKVVTYANTVNDGGEMDVTYDKVFLPSLENMYAVPQIAGEGGVHDYWRQASGRTSPLPWYTPEPWMIHYAVNAQTAPQYARFRSAYRGRACYPWSADRDGHVNSNGADNAFPGAPLVFIGASTIPAPTDAGI